MTPADILRVERRTNSEFTARANQAAEQYAQSLSEDTNGPDHLKVVRKVGFKNGALWAMDELQLNEPEKFRALVHASNRGFEHAIKLLRSKEFKDACADGPDPADWLEERRPKET